MDYDWSSVKRYSMTGWKHRSKKFFMGLLVFVVLVSFFGSAPFWVTFSSLAPILLLYFPLLGFMLETLERDWKDWHPW
jgi:hypothetical protein